MRYGFNAAVVIMSVCFMGSVSAAEWFAAPNGKKGNAGTQESPWDLQTALNHPKSVKPGDTIWLRGGDYKLAKRMRRFESRLKGAKGRQITVRNYQGERATIRAALAVGVGWASDYTDYWGLEITDRELGPASGGGLIISSSKSSNPEVNAINCIIHDTPSTGISHWAGASDSTVHGCILYNGGYDGSARGSHRKKRSVRGHGHGMYIQNKKGKLLIKNNILFRFFGNGLSPHTTNAPRHNITLEGNTVFNSSEFAARSFNKNIEFQYGTDHRGGRMIENYTYMPAKRGTVIYGNSIGGGEIRGNYFVCPGRVYGFTLKGTIKGLRMSGNTIVGNVMRGTDINKWGSGNRRITARPTSGKKIFVRPNDYEKGRANITIFNWAKSATVAVDVSKAGLKNGEKYEIRDAQNWFAKPVVTGTYSGEPVTIPMTGLTVAPILGAKHTGRAAKRMLAMKAPPHTAPEFGVFVIRKVKGGGD